MTNKRGTLSELRRFLRDLTKYADNLGHLEKLKKSERQLTGEMRIQLVYTVGKLKADIISLTGIDDVPIIVSGHESISDIWLTGFSSTINPRTRAALRYCLDATRQAIGKLKDDIKQGIRDEQGNPTGKEPAIKTKVPSDTAEPPTYLFDKMQFHTRVIESSRELFKDGHYRDAIYRAFVEVNNSVKDKAKSQLDGKGLMSTVFSPNNPIIKLNNLETQTDKDEQEGFMHLFMGAMQGIRNPKAHENIIQNNPYVALQLIGFASLLIQTISFWDVKNRSKS